MKIRGDEFNSQIKELKIDWDLIWLVSTFIKVPYYKEGHWMGSDSYRYWIVLWFLWIWQEQPDRVEAFPWCNTRDISIQGDLDVHMVALSPRTHHSALAKRVPDFMRLLNQVESKNVVVLLDALDLPPYSKETNSASWQSYRVPGWIQLISPQKLVTRWSYLKHKSVDLIA